MARRIVIKGTSGAGKTALGRALAERLGVRYVECAASRAELAACYGSGATGERAARVLDRAVSWSKSTQARSCGSIEPNACAHVCICAPAQLKRSIPEEGLSTFLPVLAELRAKPRA